MTPITGPILQERIKELVEDIDITSQIANGDKDTTVETKNGPVRSLAKLVHDSQQKIDKFFPDMETREPKSNGNTAAGFPRLDNFHLPLIDPVTKARTYLVGVASTEREQRFQDKSGTIALLTDITGTNSGVNTGDETKPGLLSKLGIPSISGVNTGDQTLEQLGGQPLLGFVPVDTAKLGQVNGVATLDAQGKVPSTQLPSYVDDVLEFDSAETFPTLGERGKIYVAVDTNEQYRWGGTFYIKLVGSPGSSDSVVEGLINKYFTESRVLGTLLKGYTVGSNAVLTATDTILSGFGKLQKQISDILPILAGKANSANPTLTGTVTVPDLAISVATSQAANAKFVQAVVESLYNRILGGAPADLNTLGFLAQAIGRDPQFANTINAQLLQRELLANKKTDFSNPNDTSYPTVRAVKEYADSLLTKVLIDCGSWDASTGVWPDMGGTGQAGAIMKGNMWFVSVPGRLGGIDVEKGDSFRALVNNPGQNPDNWSVLESNFDYVPVNKAGDSIKYLNITDAGRALHMSGQTNLAKYLCIDNGTMALDFGLESQVGGDIIDGTSSYGVSMNTDAGTINFGFEKRLALSLSKDGGKLYTSGESAAIGRNTVLALMQNNAGAELNLEMGDGTNPSVKFSYLNGELMFFVNGQVRAKFTLDGKMIVNEIERTDGGKFWHDGNMKPGQANHVATLGADSKLTDSQVPNTNKVAEGTTNKYFTEARAVASKLTGYVVSATNAVVAATDTVSQAIGKLQKQHSDLAARTTNTNTGDETKATILSKLGSSVVTGSNTGDETQASITEKLGSTDNLPEGTTNRYFTEARAVASKLAGYAVAGANAVVAASDSVSQAVGKLQKQISDLGARTTGTNTGDETKTTILSKLGVPSLSGVNTGDETRATIVTKIGYDPVNPALLGANDGIATLDSAGKVPASQLPSYVDDVIEAASVAVLPPVGETGKIYVTVDNDKTHRWTGTGYIEISASPGSSDDVAEGGGNKYFTEARVLATKLTGYAVASVNAVVAATDSVLSAIAKLQKQHSDLAARTTNTNTGDETQATITTKLGTTNNLPEGSNNLYFTEQRVIATKLINYAATQIDAVLTSADSVIFALAKLQRQILDLSGRTSNTNTGDETQESITNKLGSTDNVPEGSSNLYFTAVRVVSTALTGYAVAATNAVVSATDTVAQAFGKLQKQVTDLAGRTTGTNTGDETRATILSKTGATALTGNNTGDETRTTIVTKLGYDPVNPNLLGANNGIATLDSAGKVPASQLPSFVDDVLEFANLASLPASGETGKIYVTIADNKTHRWSGTGYVEISASPGSTDAVTEGGDNKYFTEARVLATKLTGYAVASVNAVVAAGDSVLSAMGKLQKQISDLAARTTGTNTGDETLTTIRTKLGSTTNLPEGTNLYFTAPRAVAAVLAGYVAATTNAAVAASDTVSQAIGKLQKQVSDLTTSTSGNNTGDETQASITQKLGSTDNLPEGTTNRYFTSARAVSSALAGYVVAGTNAAVAAGDNVLQAFGKLQKQLNDLLARTTNTNTGDETQSTISTKLGSTDNLNEGATNLYFTQARVVASKLAGYVVATTNVAVAAADTVSQAVGKLQKQINDLSTRTSNTNTGDETQATIVAKLGDTDKLPEGSVNLYFTVERVRAVVLAGLSVATNSAVTAADTVLSGIGKLQAQLTALAARTTGTNTGDETRTTIVSKLGNTDNLPEGSTNQYFTEVRSVAAKLTGYIVAGVNAAVAATDTVSQAIGKLQKQLNDMTVNNTGVNTGDETQATIVTKLGTTDALPEGATNQYFTSARAIASKLAGYAVATTNSAVAAADTVAQAFGKVQKQLNDLAVRTSNTNTGDETQTTIVNKLGSTDNLPEGAVNSYFTMARAVGSKLTGYTVAGANAVVAAADTVMQAIGKLQKQISDLAARTTGTNTGDETRTTIVTKIGYDPVNPSLLGKANGIATLDAQGTVPASQLPSYVDDVLEFDSLSVFPAAGERGKIYIDLSDDKTYRWSGTTYIVITASPGSTDAVPEGSTNLYFTVARVRATVLAGLSVATATVVTATDTVLSGIGKLQAQLTALAARTTGTNSGDETTATIQSKLGSTNNLAEGSNNLYFTVERVRATVLAGLTVATNSAVAAADTLLVAVGKLQAQINALAARTTNTNSGDETRATIVSKLGNTDALPEGSANQYFTVERVRATALAGLTTATNAVVAATDTLLVGVGKLQAQITALAARTSGNNTGDETQATIVAKLGDTDNLPEGGSNLYFTIARVRATVLAGLSLATNSAVTAADTVLSGIGKLQAQFTALAARTTGTNSGDETRTTIVSKLGNTDALPEGSTNQYFSVERVRATVLAGLSVATNSAVVATDTVLSGIGKLQSQLTALLARTTGTNSGDETTATIQTKLGSTDNLSEGSTNQYFTIARVRATALAGLSVATNSVVVATDTVLSGIGKLQAQITALAARTTGTNTGDETTATIQTKLGNTDNLDEGATNLYFTVARVRTTVLTNLAIFTGMVVSASDTVIQAIGKLQGQITALSNRTTGTNTGDETRATIVSKLGNTDNLPEGSSNLYMTDARVRTAPVGTVTVSAGNDTAVVATDTVQSMVSKVQSQISSIKSAMQSLSLKNLMNVIFRGYVIEKVVLVPVSSSTTVLDLSMGSIFMVAMSNISTTITFDISRVPQADLSGGSLGFAVIVTNGVTAGLGVTFSGGTNGFLAWTDKAVPTRSTAAGARDDYYFYTDSGGAVYIGSLTNANVQRE